MKYYVRSIEHTYTLRERDTSDKWDAGDYGLDVTVVAIHRSNSIKGFDVKKLREYDDIYGYDDIPVGDTAYLVVVEYTTGSTFGSEGAWCVPAIKKTEKEAKKAARLCEHNNKSTRNYRPWDGYFERLNSASVVPLPVNK